MQDCIIFQITSQATSIESVPVRSQKFQKVIKKSWIWFSAKKISQCFFRLRRKRLSGPLSFVSRLHRRGEQEPEGHRRQEGHQCCYGGWEKVLPLPPFIQTPGWTHGHSLPPKSPQSGVYMHKSVGHKCLHYVCFVFSATPGLIVCSHALRMVPFSRVGKLVFQLRCVHVRHVRTTPCHWVFFFAFYRSDCLNNMVRGVSSIWVTRKNKGNSTVTIQWMAGSGFLPSTQR